jgi:L-histidine N-alpha-methyltransferase
MRLQSLRDQTVHIAALDLTVEFTEGEQMRTEISAKFRPDAVEAELAAAGMKTLRFWTDPASDFGLTLAQSPE